MVQTEISQLGMESRTWIEQLRRERTDIGGLRERLQSIVEGSVERDSLPQVEHYENQIDIQLSNINHLKHSIKEHEKQLAWEESHPDSQPELQIQAAHEELGERFASLSVAIAALKSEFESFTKGEA